MLSLTYPPKLERLLHEQVSHPNHEGWGMVWLSEDGWFRHLMVAETEFEKRGEHN